MLKTIEMENPFCKNVIAPSILVRNRTADVQELLSSDKKEPVTI